MSGIAKAIVVHLVFMTCVSILTVIAAFVLTGALLVFRFPSPLWITLLLASVSGAVLLLIPGYSLYAKKTRQDAISLFNRASYFPLSLLVVTLMLLLLKP